MLARILFIGLIVLCVLFVLRYRDTARGRAWKRLALIGFAGVVVVSIIFPEVPQWTADLLGIGRGTDLVGYLTSFALMFLAAFVYLKFKQQDRRITELARQLALAQWSSQATSRQTPSTASELHPPTGEDPS